MRDVFFTLSLTHSLLFFCLVGWVTRTRKERELEKLGTCGRQGGRGSEPCVLAGFFPSVWVNLESRLGRLAILFFWVYVLFERRLVLYWFYGWSNGR